MGTVALGDLSCSRTQMGTMDLRALILVGGSVDDGKTPREGGMAGVPFACLDVLGATVLERVVERLKSAGISQVSLLSSAGPEAQMYVERAASRARLDTISATGEEFWQSADQAFEQSRQNGADLVLLVRIGPYVELDYEELIQHHIDKRCRMSARCWVQMVATFPIFVLDSSRRGDATTLLRSRLQTVRDDCERFVARGYVNSLRTAGDFRRLALDGLLERNGIRPIGNEVRPGVWVAEGAKIHRTARVLAPAFIGAYSKIRGASLITRNSVIEHHSEVDCGTVVENSTVLPFTYVGAGLDVMHSVVGFRRIFQLMRNVEVEISDAKLVGMPSVTALFRTAGSFAALFLVLLKQTDLPQDSLGRAARTQASGSVAGIARNTGNGFRGPGCE